MNDGDRRYRLLNDYQSDFPLTPRPFARIADRLGLAEAEVIDALQQLQADGAISRIGPVFAPGRIGASTLAAMVVPKHRIHAVARMVSDYSEVNHNYQRDHSYNLWFVATAPDQKRLASVLGEIEQRSGLAVMSLPLEADYHIDLGFELPPACTR